jgi:hypothetical protein
MRALVVLAILAGGCIDPVDPRWQLDHDHVIAVRANPPRIMPGERAELDALVAHEGSLAAIEAPANAAVLEAPEALQSVLRFDNNRWFVEAPSHEVLQLERAKLGFAEGAAVPVNVYGVWLTAAGEPLYAKKTVWLGGSATNPAMPRAMIDGAPMTADAVVPMERDVYLSVDVPEGYRVSWLTSCGQLFQDDVATSFLRVAPGDPTEGQLAVVIRDPDGGVAWELWPIRAAAN